MELIKNMLLITFYILAIIYMVIMVFMGYKLKKKARELDKEIIKLKEQRIKALEKLVEADKTIRNF